MTVYEENPNTCTRKQLELTDTFSNVTVWSQYIKCNCVSISEQLRNGNWNWKNTTYNCRWKYETFENEFNNMQDLYNETTNIANK